MLLQDQFVSDFGALYIVTMNLSVLTLKLS